MHDYTYITSAESTISRQVSGIISYLLHVPTNRTWHILNEVDHLTAVGVMNSSWLLLI